MPSASKMLGRECDPQARDGERQPLDAGLEQALVVLARAPAGAARRTGPRRRSACRRRPPSGSGRSSFCTSGHGSAICCDRSRASSRVGSIDSVGLAAHAAPALRRRRLAGRARRRRRAGDGDEHADDDQHEPRRPAARRAVSRRVESGCGFRRATRDRRGARISAAMRRKGQARARMSTGVESPGAPMPSPRAKPASRKRPASAPSEPRSPGRPCRVLEQRHFDLIGLGAGRARELLLVRLLPGLGRRQGRRRAAGGLRAAVRQGRLPGAGGAVRHRRGAGAAADAAVGAPGQGGRRVPVLRRAGARLRGRLVRLGPERLQPAGTCEADHLQDPRRRGRRVVLLGHRTRCSPQFGTNILFLLLIAAGVLLLTGASIAGIVKATHQGVAPTTDARAPLDAAISRLVVTGKEAARPKSARRRRTRP